MFVGTFLFLVTVLHNGWLKISQPAVFCNYGYTFFKEITVISSANFNIETSTFLRFISFHRKNFWVRISLFQLFHCSTSSELLDLIKLFQFSAWCLSKKSWLIVELWWCLCIHEIAYSSMLIKSEVYHVDSSSKILIGCGS